MYRSLNTHSTYGTDQSTLEKYLGVTHLSGISVSILIISWSETVQPNYLHVNVCHNDQKSIRNANINEKPCFVRFLPVLARDGIFQSDFHYAYDAFTCSYTCILAPLFRAGL